MPTFSEFNAAQFENAQPASRDAVVRRELFHLNDTVAQAHDVRIGAHASFVHFIVQEQDSAAKSGEFLLQSKKLAAVA